MLALLLIETDLGRLAGLSDDPALRLPVLTARPSPLDHPATNDRVAGFTPEEKTAVCRIAAREGKAARLIGWLATKKLLDKDGPADAVARLRDFKDPSLQEEVNQRFGEATAIFNRTCASCHKLFGEGAEIDPELISGGRGSIDHWLDNILDPNALIGQRHALHLIEKTDGSSVVGILAAENEEELVLRMVGLETKDPQEGR